MVSSESSYTELLLPARVLSPAQQAERLSELREKVSLVSLIASVGEKFGEQVIQCGHHVLTFVKVICMCFPCLLLVYILHFVNLVFIPLMRADLFLYLFCLVTIVSIHLMPGDYCFYTSYMPGDYCFYTLYAW